MMSAGFLMYLFMTDFLPGRLFAVVVMILLWLAWMCDVTWHHKPFLVQLNSHLAKKLYCSAVIEFKMVSVRSEKPVIILVNIF